MIMVMVMIMVLQGAAHDKRRGLCGHGRDLGTRPFEAATVLRLLLLSHLRGKDTTTAICICI